MTTPPSPQDTGRVSKTSSSSSGTQPRSTSGPSKNQQGQQGKRPPASGTTGSLSATNPKRKRVAAASHQAKKGGKHRRVRKGGSPSSSNVRHGKQAAGASHARPKKVRARAQSTTHATGAKRPVKATGYNTVAKHSAKTKSSKISIPLIAGIAVAALIVVVGGFFAVRTLLVGSYTGTTVEDGKEVTVVIPEGADGGTIRRTLLEAGVIRSGEAFRRAVADQNADMTLRCGTYTFVTGSDPQEVVKQLVAGPNTSEGQLQLPEGLTVQQTAQLVESSLGIPSAEFLAQAKASTYAEEFPFLKEAANDSLEGFLYPKTYDFAGKEVTADGVVRAMLDQFYTEFSALDTRSASKALSDRYGLTVTNYDIIKIASIIEEEAKNEEDRPMVSSVFYNRLSSNMALQSDATMGYVTGGTISSADLSTESPYNTYLYKGLPPTPICSPSEWAIDAAMHPADTDYLFFFIIEDGDYKNHTFSRTYEEHDAAYSAALAEQAQAGATGTAQGTATAVEEPAPSPEADAVDVEDGD